MQKMYSRKRTSSAVEHSAPYRKPVIAPSVGNASTSTQKGASLLQRVKSFFHGDERLSHLSRSDDASSDQKLYHVPGGFYDVDARNPVVKLPSALAVGTAESSGNFKATLSDGEEDEPNISNAKLAQFFREKGDAPLTEIEYEGVMSLIKRSQSVASTPDGKNILPKEVSELRVLRSTSDTTYTPLRAPSYTPKYGNIALHNTNSAGTSTPPTRRRVFDYSRLPSPYRTTVYKYSAAKVPSQGTTTRKTSENAVSKPVKSTHAPKKLSHTASALISLLDGEGKADISESSAYASLSNPYSSHISHMHRGRPSSAAKTIEPSTKPVNTETTPITSTALEELSNAKQAVPPHATQPVSGFKPSRPSSLRVEVTVEKSPEKSPRQPVPQSSKFNFSFQKPKDHNVDTLSEKPHTIPDATSTFSFQPLAKVEESNTHGATLNGPMENNISGSSLQSNGSFNFSNGIQKVSQVHKSEDKHNTTSRTPFAFSFSKPDLPKDDSSFAENTAASAEAVPFHFDFGTLPVSGIDPSSVDEEKVKRLKSTFTF
ncbi:AFL004Cp [Eremothecium gossypii ATCC 10895]|uniref:AFL004Cp n=1 Tax=Eremothecium gossypii (strain ATCC 10895 / CBS 109.51 / FGSC 9923 / NRRL Y-1056) TaxID=284811 RepID=Q754S5_EREGS|nr:AFL004Cp [Eremothecium gossypii ATCC 10895]AAS53368.1 AFL004Cp [Eremothecium gossypii ATCC 10895]